MGKKKGKVYIAGPDVFELEAKIIGKRIVDYADKLELVGLFPLDNEINLYEENVDLKIFSQNMLLLESSDYVIANLNNFRGGEPDSGTVWEAAYAVAKGKTVIGYVNSDKSLLEKVQEIQKVSQVGDLYLDAENKIIENFNNKLNLMLEYGLTKLIVGTAEDALDYIYHSIK